MAAYGSQTPTATSSSNLKQLQGQVNDVVSILKANIDKIMKRGDGLDYLDSKTKEVEQAANSFQKTAVRVARKYWWKNMKMKIIISVIVVVIIILIILFATKVI